MKRKIYGVPGQLECKLIIHSGPTMAEVNFKGGSITDISRRPARFATSRFLEQTIIENSNEYKCGKIVLMHEMEVPDDEEEKARKAAEVSTITSSTTQNTPVVENVNTNTLAEPSKGSVETVEVSCKADAVEWLKERYPEKGYNGNNLRSKDAFEAACKEAGVEFIIANA